MAHGPTARNEIQRKTYVPACNVLYECEQFNIFGVKLFRPLTENIDLSKKKKVLFDKL